MFKLYTHPLYFARKRAAETKTNNNSEKKNARAHERIFRGFSTFHMTKCDGDAKLMGWVAAVGISFKHFITIPK